MLKLTVLILIIMTFENLKASVVDQKEFKDPTRHLSLNSKGTVWDFFSPEDLSSKTTVRDHDLQFVVRSPYVVDGLQPTLTMRIDHGPYKSARAYGEKWLKDFPKFGYELQMSRDSTLGLLSGFEIELNSASSHRVVRQFIVKANAEFWVFTCTSDQAHFPISWSACEKILKTSH
jgi:hypothetical protein